MFCQRSGLGINFHVRKHGRVAQGTTVRVAERAWVPEVVFKLCDQGATAFAQLNGDCGDNVLGLAVHQFHHGTFTNHLQRFVAGSLPANCSKRDQARIVQRLLYVYRRSGATHGAACWPICFRQSGDQLATVGNYKLRGSSFEGLDYGFSGFHVRMTPKRFNECGHNAHTGYAKTADSTVPSLRKKIRYEQ